MTTSCPPAPRPARTKITSAQRTGVRVVSHVLDAKLARGAPLVAGTIGEALGLSRFPIQQGLAWLRDQGLAHQPNGRGFVLSATRATLRKTLDRVGDSSASPYLTIAQDRLKGVLPKSITETDLAQRYGITRAQLNPILKRMAQEGWIRRREGHGWQFTDIIDSPRALGDAYAFRIAIEPAALMAPTFQVDKAVLDSLRMEQTALRDGRLGRIGGQELFEIGARFHETLVGFSGNPFFLDALRQVNRLRRLLEYKAMANPAGFMEQCVEHLALIDMLERGERRAAAQLLRRHLDVAGSAKRHRLTARTRRNPI